MKGYSKMSRTLITYGSKECYIDDMLLQKLENIKKIIKRNWDCVILIDGMERSGKSTLGLTIAWYLSEGKLTYDNIASDSDDAIRKCERLPDCSQLMIDEGSLVFSSKETMSAEQRKLIKIMNVIGQKNMVFIIILPSFFDLNKFIAVNRSRFLLHVYTDNQLHRGRFTYFSEKKKKILYDYGKKHYNSYKFPKANWVGGFWNFFPFENKEFYKEIKQKSLFEAFHKQEEKKREEKKELIVQTYNRLVELHKKKGIQVSNKEYGDCFGLPNTTFRVLLYGREGKHKHSAQINNLPINNHSNIVKEEANETNGY
jgi:hypothetical protein